MAALVKNDDALLEKLKKEGADVELILLDVRLGDDVRLAVTERCPRCVMTTLPQGGLHVSCRDTGVDDQRQPRPLKQKTNESRTGATDDRWSA